MIFMFTYLFLQAHGSSCTPKLSGNFHSDNSRLEYLQDIFRSAFQDSFIPGVETSWKALFAQFNAKFQGLLKDGAIAHQKFEAADSPLAVALKVCTQHDTCDMEQILCYSNSSFFRL